MRAHTQTHRHTHGEREEKGSFIGDFGSHLRMAVNFQSYILLIRFRMEFQPSFLLCVFLRGSLEGLSHFAHCDPGMIHLAIWFKKHGLLK